MIKIKAMRKGRRGAVIDQIDNRANQFIAAVISNGSTLSRTKAPVAYSVLVNSQFMEMKVTDNKVIGSVGYNVSYAEYLEGTPENPANWKPKPPPKYGTKDGQSPAMAWNPEAQPGFLRYGFESTEAIANIERLKQIFWR